MQDAMHGIFRQSFALQDSEDFAPCSIEHKSAPIDRECARTNCVDGTYKIDVKRKHMVPT